MGLGEGKPFRCHLQTWVGGPTPKGFGWRETVVLSPATLDRGSRLKGVWVKGNHFAATCNLGLGIPPQRGLGEGKPFCCHLQPWIGGLTSKGFGWRETILLSPATLDRGSRLKGAWVKGNHFAVTCNPGLGIPPQRGLGEGKPVCCHLQPWIGSLTSKGFGWRETILLSPATLDWGSHPKGVWVRKIHSKMHRKIFRKIHRKIK